MIRYRSGAIVIRGKRSSEAAMPQPIVSHTNSSIPPKEVMAASLAPHGNNVMEWIH
jgi:hypothetical protein